MYLIPKGTNSKYVVFGAFCTLAEHMLVLMRQDTGDINDKEKKDRKLKMYDGDIEMLKFGS